MYRASDVRPEFDVTRVPVLSDDVFDLIEEDCVQVGAARI